MNSVAGPVSLDLACHPQTPSPAIYRIAASVAMAPGDSLSLVFALEGDLSRLRIPEPGLPQRADGLWTHTCLEAFVMAEHGPGYREFNFSPSGEWAVYAFRGYRNAGEPETGPAPVIAVRRSRDRLELDARICHDFPPRARPLRLGLSAVLEDTGGELSYWALRHPAGRPDFHHPEAFALQLELP
jgi:hypothetical protein